MLNSEQYEDFSFIFAPLKDVETMSLEWGREEKNEKFVS